MRKIILKRLTWSLPIIIISTILLISFLSMYNPLAPYDLFLPVVYVPIFALIITYQVVYNIFFFLSLRRNNDKIETSKSVKEFFPTWQRITVKISRIFITTFLIIMLLWFGFSFMNSKSYEKGVDKYLSPKYFLNYDLVALSTDIETHSDFASLFPMISYSKSETYIYKDGDESENINISVFILENLPNRIIDSCYTQKSLNSSEKKVYKLSENSNDLMNLEKTNIPFETKGLTGYYTVDKFVGSDTIHVLNSTEIAVKSNGVYVKLNISFSDSEDFSQFDIDKAISVVCDLANAAGTHSLYSASTALMDFSSQYSQ